MLIGSSWCHHITNPHFLELSCAPELLFTLPPVIFASRCLTKHISCQHFFLPCTILPTKCTPSPVSWLFCDQSTSGMAAPTPTTTRIFGDELWNILANRSIICKMAYRTPPSSILVTVFEILHRTRDEVCVPTIIAKPSVANPVS